MVSAHFSSRDQRGLPVLRRVSRRGVIDTSSSEEQRATEHWNELQKHLRAITSNIRNYEELIEFVERWVLRNLKLWKHCPNHQEAKQTVGQGIADLAENEIAQLEEREKAVCTKWLDISAALKILFRHALDCVPDSFPAGQPHISEQPRTFLRYYHDDSYTYYNDSLGFLCSGWRACLPANSFTELKEKGMLTGQKIRNHCEKAGSPSDWISLCNDASWMLKYVSKSTKGKIAIISVPKLDRMNVLWIRSDLLVQQSGEECYSGRTRNGVQYAWPGHYLVFGWIPAQCIIKTLTMQRFRILCKDNAISEGQYSAMCDGKVQLTHFGGDITVRHPHLLLQSHSDFPSSSQRDTVAGACANLEQLRIV